MKFLKQMKLAAAIVGLGFILGGCSSLMFWKHDDEKSAPAASEPVKPEAEDKGDKADKGDKGKAAAKDEQELKLAKLWSRVDELEEESYKQKERIRVLEKGLMLGLVPEELKHPEKTKPDTATAAAPEKKAAKSEAKAEAKDEEAEDAPAVVEKDKAKTEKMENTAPAELSKEDAEKYQKLLAEAHDHYSAGRYGRAIVEYSEIGKQFGDKVGGGMHLYWVAKCWSNLKEYNTARQHLLDFLKDHGTSPWAPRAKLELARVEWQLGMQETALQRFREIIQEHPYEDAAEMAKMELENLDKKL